MKKLFFYLALVSFPLQAEQTKTVFNPFTGKLDFITALSTTSIKAGTNITVTTTSTGVTIGSSGSGGGPSGQINVSNQNDIPFYSVSGSSNVLSGSPGISVSTLTVTSTSTLKYVTISTFTASSATITAVSISTFIASSGTATNLYSSALTVRSQEIFGANASMGFFNTDNTGLTTISDVGSTGTDQLSIQTNIFATNASNNNFSGDVSALTYSGGSLSTCGDATHGLGYSGGNFTCQNITGSGGGGSSSLAIATGNASGFTVPGTSPTAVINLNSTQFSSSLKGSATAFVSIYDLGYQVSLSSGVMGTLPASSMNKVSLSSSVIGTLPTGNMVSTVAYTNSTQTFTAAQIFTSSVTVYSTFTIVYATVSINGIPYQFPSGVGAGGMFLVSGSSVITVGASPVLLSSFSTTTPLTYNNATGVIGLGLVSLSSSVVGALPASNMNLVSLSSSVIGTLPAANMNLVSLSSSVTGTLPASSMNLVSLSSSVTGTLPAVNMAAVSLSSSVIGTLPATNMAVVSLSSSVIGTLPASNMNLVSLSSSVTGVLQTANMVSTVAYISSTQTWTGNPTFGSTAGAAVTYGFTTGTGTFYTTVISTNAVIIKSTDNLTMVRVDNTYPLPGDYLITVSSVPGGNGGALFGVNTYGHVMSSGTTPAVSACGTSPSISANATDFSGTINVGSVSATACTLTFANVFTNIPTCVVSDDNTGITADVQSISASAVTFGFSISLAGGHVYYICIGNKG